MLAEEVSQCGWSDFLDQLERGLEQQEVTDECSANVIEPRQYLGKIGLQERGHPVADPRFVIDQAAVVFDQIL